MVSFSFKRKRRARSSEDEFGCDPHIHDCIPESPSPSTRRRARYRAVSTTCPPSADNALAIDELRDSVIKLNQHLAEWIQSLYKVILILTVFSGLRVVLRFSHAGDAVSLFLVLVVAVLIAKSGEMERGIVEDALYALSEEAENRRKITLSSGARRLREFLRRQVGEVGKKALEEYYTDAYLEIVLSQENSNDSSKSRTFAYSAEKLRKALEIRESYPWLMNEFRGEAWKYSVVANISRPPTLFSAKIVTLCGFDRLGYPVLWSRHSRQDRRVHSIEQTIMENLLLMEAAIRLSDREAVILIGYMKDISRRSFSVKDKLVLKSMLEAFPDRLEALVMVGAGAVARTLWAAAKPFTPRRFASKLRVLTTSTAQKTMSRTMDFERFAPDVMGGKGDHDRFESFDDMLVAQAALYENEFSS